MKTISRIELEHWQDNDRSFALIDVLPDRINHDRPQQEKQTRDFLEKLCLLGISDEQPIVLYEADSASIEATAAAEVLMQEGFHEVYRFTGPQSGFYGTQHGVLQ